MKIFGLEKLSMVDYDDKLACTVFTAGCNFACPFCHNFDLVNGTRLTEIPEREVLEYVELRKKMLDGVVISGGEPTLMPDLADFAAKIKKIGLSVKLDTNGSDSKKLVCLVNDGLVDYVAMDVKNSLEKYSQTAGKPVNIDEITASINFLKQNVVPYEFRTTLVKQFHDQKSITDMAQLLDGAQKMFLQKFDDSHGCLQQGLCAVDKSTAEQFADILSKKIKHVALRGY